MCSYLYMYIYIYIYICGLSLLVTCLIRLIEFATLFATFEERPR